jgi:hypothetical protein
MDLGVAGEFVLANIMTKVTPLLQNRNSGCISRSRNFGLNLMYISTHTVGI